MIGRHRGAPARVTARRRGEPGGAHRHGSGQKRTIRAAGTSAAAAAEKEARRRLQAHDLWERHGAATYALARALLSNDLAAAKAVELGMTDLAGGAGEEGSPDETRRALARQVYLRCQELDDQLSRSRRLPASMVWLGQLAQLQRASLALCVFGGHTHREAAALIGVPPATVAGSLSAGLRELGVLSAGDGPAAAAG